MSTLANKPPKTSPLATDVFCDDDMLHVDLDDGRKISVPLEWFPILANANPEQRKGWSLIGKGIGIHWEEIDEDISIESLLRT